MLLFVSCRLCMVCFLFAVFVWGGLVFVYSIVCLFFVVTGYVSRVFVVICFVRVFCFVVGLVAFVVDLCSCL